MAYRFGTHAIADAQWLAVTEGIVNGARWLDQVLQHFPSPQAILHCSQAATSQYQLSSLQSAIDAASTKQSAAMLQSSGCLHLVIPSDLEYPPLLAECEDRPPFLFVLGDLTAISASSLSIVGTRKPSLDGTRGRARGRGAHCGRPARRYRPDLSLPPSRSQRAYRWLWGAGQRVPYGYTTAQASFSSPQ